MTNTSNPTLKTRPARSRRGLRIALVLSLMVNVLLIGVLAGGMARYARFAPDVMTRPDFRSLWHALPDEARTDLRALARNDEDNDDHDRRPPRAARRERAEAVNGQILEMLRTEAFDEAEFADLLGSERARNALRLDRAQTAFADRVASLTYAQRLEMAQSLEERWARRPSR